MPGSRPRARGARNHPRPSQGVQPQRRTSAAPGLVLATENGGGITGRALPVEAAAADVADPLAAHRRGVREHSGEEREKQEDDESAKAADDEREDGAGDEEPGDGPPEH